ncbi:hypothetical protein ANN_14978 [Periplaneta americana]|uniref:Wings apart-like protein C-terminal domain-containing protein n=1 Tax=Periplaneta americana TaxID=6978 RepID=A0ABQ8SZE3_PERAM|nr:hypothetical protein ANN_14978 [Periplaneta americana]
METTHRTNTAAGTNKLTVPFYAPPPYVKKTSAEIISEARASIIRDNEGIRIESTRMAASIRPVNTKRPFTPRERQRTLFGTARKSSCRPPSSFSLGYAQFQEADLNSSISTTPPHVRRLNPIPATPSSASLNASNSLVDLRDWKTLLTNTNVESSASTLAKKGRVLSAQPFGTFFTPDQINSAANKFRLPSIDSAKPLLSRRHQFRATASLDNLPEELEVDESDSEDAGANSSSTKEVPTARKAYSSPVQRTRSMDTELGHFTAAKLSTSDGRKSAMNHRSLMETDSALNKDTKESLKTADSLKETGGSTASGVRVIVEDPSGANIAHYGILDYKKEQEKAQRHALQQDSSLHVKDKKENTSKSEQKISSKTKTQVEPSSDVTLSQGDNKIEGTKISKTKKKTSSASGKRSKSVTGKDSVPRDIQLEDNAFGPELDTVTTKKEGKPTNKIEGRKNKSDIKESINISSVPKENSQSVIKGDSIIKQTLATGDSSAVSENWTSVSQTKMLVDTVTKSELHNPTNVLQQAKPEMASEVKTKRSLQQTKQTNETAEGYVSKKPKSEDNNLLSPTEVKSSSVQSILAVLNNLAGKEEYTEEVISLMSKLYTALEAEGGIGKNIQNTKLRGQVLKTLYKFVESSNETLLLQIARIILAFRVSGKNLSGVCKLVFKVSRCDKNDKLFLEDNILELFVEALGSASPLEDAESCVYGYGALKFLTMNNVLLAKVLKLGILELMVLHMKMVNAAVIAQTEDALQRAIYNLQIIASDFNMEISKEKTKVMAFSGENPIPSKIMINNTLIERVNSFNYLGYNLSYITDEDMSNKISKFIKITGVINAVFKPSHGQKHTRLKRVEGSRIPEQTSHALFQLTGALRNVAGEEEMFSQFVTTGAVNELCQAMELFSSDLDVISNISRTLSIISTHEDCCTAIVDYENSFKIFVKLFQKFPGRQDIIVRLGYALGNLMAGSDTARTKFFNEDGAVAAMLNLLTIYLDKDLQMLGSAESHSEISSDAGSSGSVEDVIVKIIRIFANMSINPMVGSSLTCSSPVFYSNNVQQIEIEISNIAPATTESSKDGGQFLDILLTVLRRKSVVESEELVHSVLSTLNNLSYYPTSNDGAFGERELEIAQGVLHLIC